MNTKDLSREELERRLEEAQATLDAIGAGQVDALVLHGPEGDQVFSLRGSESPYRILVESMSEAAIWLDAAGTVVYANGRLARLLGRPLTSILGQPFEKQLAEGDRARFKEILKGPGQTIRGEYSMLGETGATPVLLSVRPFQDEGENVFAVVATDLTAQKQVERTLAKQAAELEVANRELETFNYSVSHDLRNPLTILRGSIAIMVADPSAETVREFGSEAKASADRMGQIIDSLLALSRMSRAPVERQPVDLSSMAAAVAKRLSTQHAARAVEVAIEADLKDNADPSLLLIVLENLLNNAFKFTRKNPKARVEVGRTTTEHGPTYYVRDNGVGFDVRNAGRLFEPFSRLHHFDEFEGTGIGLATVARILRRHGGRIWATSSPGSGTSFWFTLGPPPEVSAPSSSVDAPATVVSSSAAMQAKSDSPAKQLLL